MNDVLFKVGKPRQGDETGNAIAERGAQDGRSSRLT